MFCQRTKYKIIYKNNNSRTGSDNPDDDNLVGGIHIYTGVESVNSFVQLADTESQTCTNTEHCSNN